MPRRRASQSVFVAFGLLASLAARAPAQSEAWRAHGVSSVPHVGRSVAFLGDVDGDGVPDFIAGGPSNEEYGPPGTGHALLCSGASGTVLFDFVGDARASFGSGVASAGDLDGDGIDDVAIGAPTAGKGAVYCYSGATNALLRTLNGATAKSLFGSSLASLGDLDGDGVADLAVGAPNDVSGGTALGLAVIYSGKSGAVLAQWSGASVNGAFGSLVADAGDVDRLGKDDLLVVEQADASSGSAVGTVRVYSGDTLALIHSWTMGAAAGGWTAANAGDVNGDGTLDLILGNDLWPPFRWISYPYVSATGGAWVIDGGTGAILYSYIDFTQCGRAGCAAGDIDRDGFGDFAVGFRDTTEHVGIFSGQSGAMLTSGDGIVGALEAGPDLDGDGFLELLVGMPDDSSHGSGAVKVFSPAKSKYLASAYGSMRDDQLGRASALLGDVDGDGVGDVLAATLATYDGLLHARVLSGRDASELRDHTGTFQDAYAYAVAALPDLDGDAIGEYAITVPGPMGASQGRVEVRSGATGNLLNTLAPAGGGPGAFGYSCAVGIQPSGAAQLAVGAPYGSVGHVFVFDLASGALVFGFGGSGTPVDVGTSVAFLGDVDGDGTGDWATGMPRTSRQANGSVLVLSGATGTKLHTLTGPNGSAFGLAIAGAGDVDGDSVADLYVASPWEGTNGQGNVYVYSGATWSLLRTWNGTDPMLGLGTTLTTIGDLNGDGVSDVLVGEFGHAFLRSGGSGGLLYRFDGAPSYDQFAATPPGVAAPGAKSSTNGDPIPDVSIGAQNDSTNGAAAGRLSLYFLDDLYLQIDPPAAAAGNAVTFTTSGAPSGNLSALVLLGFDSTPLFVPLVFSTFTADETWSVAGAVPPGFAGHTLTLGSLAIGYSGKVVETQPMELLLQ